MLQTDLVSQLVSESISIRAAQAEDVNVIYEFICALKDESFDYGLFKELYERSLTKSENFYLVATVGNNVIGYVSCYEQILLHRLGKVFEIQELFVQEEYRSKGIGRILLNAVEKEIGSQNYKSLEVTANVKRVSAHKFYIECGFRQTHFKFTKPKGV